MAFSRRLQVDRTDPYLKSDAIIGIWRKCLVVWHMSVPIRLLGAPVPLGAPHRSPGRHSKGDRRASCSCKPTRKLPAAESLQTLHLGWHHLQDA